MKILRRRIERKIEDVLEDHLGFRRGKEPRGAIGMLKIIPERTLDIDKELCACFINWQMAFDHVNWTKLMQILNVTGINWCKRKTDQQIVCVSEYYTKTLPCRDKKSEEWKRS